jgi:hypothetical protein
MKKFYILVITLLMCNFSFAQLSIEGTPKSFLYKDLAVLLTASIEVEQPDLDTVIKQDNSDESMNKIRRFGVIIPVKVDFFEKADMAEVEDGRLWILKLSSSRAQALSLYSSNFYLPKGGELYIYNPDHSQVIGAFTSINNIELKTFATELIYGDEMIIEYFQPNSITEQASIEITELGYAYRDCQSKINDIKFGEYGSSGSCNVNANCSEGNNYRQAQRGVARIQIRMNETSTGWCTGSLVNNTNRDLLPYLLSAHHCVENVQSAVYYSQFIFYFNYQTSGCTNVSEPGYRTLTGTIVKAKGTKSDFVLFQLNNAIPSYFNAYWNGWTRTLSASTSGVGIHHPQGDVKKISTYNSTLTTASYPGYTANVHWKVQWVKTTNGFGITEGGSSGSPLFNSSSKIVGTLTGGSSSCFAPVASKLDYYGKFSYAWNQNGTTANTQLKPWLDPRNTGVMELNGDDNITVSLEDVLKEEETLSMIFPNPANNIINITLSAQKTETKVTIYDHLGKIILSEIIPANKTNHSISSQNLSSGHYIIRYNSGEKTWINKLVINND